MICHTCGQEKKEFIKLYLQIWDQDPQFEDLTGHSQSTLCIDCYRGIQGVNFASNQISAMNIMRNILKKGK